MDSRNGCRSLSSWRISSWARRMYARQARCSSSVSQRGGAVRGTPSVRECVGIGVTYPSPSVPATRPPDLAAWRRGPCGCGNVDQMSETKQRLAWLDALSGFAALCVVFDHGSTLLLLPLRSYLYHWFNLGPYGVFVFFLVSGYILPASLERTASVPASCSTPASPLSPPLLLLLPL